MLILVFCSIDPQTPKPPATRGEKLPMEMGVDRRWHGAGRRDGRHPWGVAGRFDAGVVAERGIGAAQHGHRPERGAISRTEPTGREDRINGLWRAVVRLCLHQSGKRL